MKYIQLIALSVGYFAMLVAFLFGCRVAIDAWRERRGKIKLINWKIDQLERRSREMQDSERRLWDRLNELTVTYREHFEAHHSAERKEVK